MPPRVLLGGFFRDAEYSPRLKLGEPIVALNAPANALDRVRLPRFVLMLVLTGGKAGDRHILVGRVNGPSLSSEAVKDSFEWPSGAPHYADAPFYALRREQHLIIAFEGPGLYEYRFTLDGEPLVTLALPLLVQ